MVENSKTIPWCATVLLVLWTILLRLFQPDTVTGTRDTRTYTMNLNSTNPFLNDIGDLNHSLLLDERHADIRPFTHPTNPPITSTPARFAAQITPPTAFDAVMPTMQPPTVMPPVTNIPIVYVQQPLQSRTVQPFNGFAHEDAVKFLGEFESYLTLSNIDLEADSPSAVAAFHLQLNGPARIWLSCLSVKQTWRFRRKEVLDPLRGRTIAKCSLGFKPASQNPKTDKD